MKEGPKYQRMTPLMKVSREVTEQLEIFSTYLKNEGLRMTSQRQLVAQSFLSTDGHLSAEELYELVKRKDKRIGFATVFRTLKALTDCSLARQVDLSDGRTRFERLYKRPHHHHLICVQCNRTTEFSSPELEQLQREIVSKYHFLPQQHTLQVLGVCRDCQEERTPTEEVFDSNLVFARDALKIAMETERRGVDFYRTVSQTITYPVAESTFRKMLEDEKKHLKALQEEWDELIQKNKKILKAPVFLHFDFDALKRIFPSREQTRQRLQENLGVTEALELAMKMEKEAHNFFKEYAEKFEDTRGRDIFLKFAAEEEEHYNLIKLDHDRLVEQTAK